jgi:hypothetical protein
MSKRRRVTGLLIVLLALPALALSEPATTDELGRNGRLLEKWRADPEHYARLMRDLRAFWAEPAARREQLRKLDRDLAELDSLTQKRLWDVMEGYSLWLDHLAEPERKRIEATADHRERLRLIREIKERQWIERLPARVQKELRALPEGQQAAEVARLRQEERQRRQPWQNLLRQRFGPPARPVRPARLSDFPDEVQAFVNNTLRSQLSDEERDQLKKAEGKWPALPALILELSERHPILPQLPDGGYTRFQKLPAEVKRLLPRNRPELVKHENRWPDYALAVHDLLRREGKTLPKEHPLGACKPEHFSALVQAAIKDKLYPQLAAGEKKQLEDADGKWPEYPRLLHELARKHEVALPGLTLPGPRELWESVRSALPEVPDHILRDFAVAELSKEERASLQLSSVDPDSRDRLKQAYFKKHPQELSRLRRLDRKAFLSTK